MSGMEDGVYMSTNLTKNFYKNEFACKHCGQYVDSLHIAKQLQALRDYISKKEGRDVRIIVHCGLRCKTHNKNVGGVPGSHHLPEAYEIGQGAADCHAHGMSNWVFRRHAKKAYKLGIISALGLYSWGIHTDTGRKRRWGNFWTK